jgi:hypothetical protein
LVTLGAELRERGIGLHVIEQGIDTATMEGRAMFGMLSVLAELQRELIVANTNDASRPRGPEAPSAGAGPSSPRTRPNLPSSCTTHGRRPSSKSSWMPATGCGITEEPAVYFRKLLAFPDQPGRQPAGGDRHAPRLSRLW